MCYLCRSKELFGDDDQVTENYDTTDDTIMSDPSSFSTLGGKWGDSNGFMTTGQVVTWSLAGTVFDKLIGANSVALSTFLNFDYVGALKEAFQAWANVSGVEFVQVADDNTTFNDVTVDSNGFITNSAYGGAGDIRINAGYIDGNSGTLAYAYGPGSSDNANDFEFRGNITFDSGESSFWNYQSFLTVAMHEIGHSIGLDHTTVPNSLMNPTYNRSVPTVQSDDIAGAQAIYGSASNSSNLLNLKSGFDTELLESYYNLTVNGSTDSDSFIGSKGNQTINGDQGNDLLFGDTIEVGMFMQVAQDVYRLYITALGRTPDSNGHYDWTISIGMNNATLDNVVDGFVGSSEFVNGVGLLNNTDFVTHLYQNALGRNPDPAGLSNWVSQLNAGASKASIILGFSQSSEAQNIYDQSARTFIETNSASYMGDNAYRIYQVILNRDPDAPGLSDWSYGLAAGASLPAIVEGFLNSAEFQNTYGGITDGEFVTLLYQNAFGRAPDAPGFTNWINSLNNGASRAEITVGFIESQEMIGVSNANYTPWVRSQGVDDTIRGGMGNDILAGGVLSDVFYFDVNDTGNDIVRDLEAWDYVQFEGFGFSSASDVLALMTQIGDEVVFSSGGVNINFLDTQLSDFTDDMFIFT